MVEIAKKKAEALHSNLVLFKSCFLSLKHCALNPLHSNLVLFKSISAFSNQYLSGFTFQSGSIQIIRQTLHLDIQHLYIPIWFYSNPSQIVIRFDGSLFTFQSGSIQIYNQAEIINISATLYIPIWFYSNVTVSFNMRFAQFFTFQSGSIQIRPYHTTYLYRLKSTFLSTDK